MSLSPVIDRKKWTEAELQALPDDGFNYEVVNGELVMSPKNSPKHGQICARLLTALSIHATNQKLGALLSLRAGLGD